MVTLFLLLAFVACGMQGEPSAQSQSTVFSAESDPNAPPFVHMADEVTQENAQAFLTEMIARYPSQMREEFSSEDWSVVFTGEDEINGEHVLLFHFGPGAEEDAWNSWASEDYAVADSGRVYRSGLAMDASDLDEQTWEVFSQICQDIYGDGSLPGIYMAGLELQFGLSTPIYRFTLPGGETGGICKIGDPTGVYDGQMDGFYLVEPYFPVGSKRVFHLEGVGWVAGQEASIQYGHPDVIDTSFECMAGGMYAIMLRAGELLWPDEELTFTYREDVVCENRMLYLYDVFLPGGEPAGAIAADETGSHAAYQLQETDDFIKLEIEGSFPGDGIGYYNSEQEARTVSVGDAVEVIQLGSRFLDYGYSNRDVSVAFWYPGYPG